MTEADTINAVLQDLHLSQSFYCRCELSSTWGLSLPGHGFARFHFVAEGACWLQYSAGLTALSRGDLVVLPYGQGHSLLSKPGASPVVIDSLPHEVINEKAALLRYGGQGERSLILCGGLRFAPRGHPLLEALPEALFLRVQEKEKSSQVKTLLEMISSEAA